MVHTSCLVGRLVGVAAPLLTITAQRTVGAALSPWSTKNTARSHVCQVITNGSGWRASSKIDVLSVVAAVVGLTMLLLAGHAAAQAAATDASQPVIGAELTIATGVTSADSDTVRPGRPGIAFDGTNYLVVSCSDLAAPTGIIGVFVSPEGQVGSPFHIASALCSTRPAVAFDGTNYLAAFSRDGQIIGMRVSPSGVVLDAPDGFYIGASIFDPAVAFDGTHYLVVWNEFVVSPHDPFGGHDLFGARVTPQGQVLDDPPLTIFAAVGEQVFPSVAFDGVNYLVAWRDTRTGSGPGADTDIFASRITPAGINLNPNGIAISTAPQVQDRPHVTFGAGNYLVVWVDARNDPFQFLVDVIATRVSPEGVLLDGPSDTGGIAVNTLPGRQKISARAEFDGSNFIIVWNLEGFFPPAGIRAARISPDGALLDGPPESEGLVIAEPDCQACRLVFPSIASDGTGTSLVSWVNNTELSGTTKDVHGALISEEVDPLTAIETLRAHVGSLALSRGTSDSLLPQLDRALALLQDDNLTNDSRSIDFLEQFVFLVETNEQIGKIDDGTASDLIAQARAIIADLTGHV